MIKVRILIKGDKVQGVGYRLFLLQKALESGIDRIYIRNIDSDKVELLIHDEESRVESFYKIIRKERPAEAEVSSIDKEPYENKIPIPQIDRYFQFLTLEQLVKGREEVVKKVPDFLSKRIEPVATALNGISDKLGNLYDRLARACFSQT